MRIDITGNRARGSKGRIAVVAAVGCVFCLAVAAAQNTNQSGPRSTVKGFRAPLDYYDPPYELQVRSFLEGAVAEPGADGMVVIHEARLTTYHENGSNEMVVTAPLCTYDTHAQIVSSAGPLHVDQIDQNVRVDGVGFYWLQTNSYLHISNQQQTTVYGRYTNTFAP